MWSPVLGNPLSRRGGRRRTARHRASHRASHSTSDVRRYPVGAGVCEKHDFSMSSCCLFNTHRSHFETKGQQYGFSGRCFFDTHRRHWVPARSRRLVRHFGSGSPGLAANSGMCKMYVISLLLLLCCLYYQHDHYYYYHYHYYYYC